MGRIDLASHGRTLIATLEHPPHGLMDGGIVDALEALVERASNDDDVGAVVLTGAHPERFIAHYDVSELLAGAHAGPAAGLAAVERFHAILLAMNRSGAVFVAAINGSAMGGGCELALACDVRLIAGGDQHMLGQPEILLGFPPGGGGTQRLARMLGSARALALVLDGGPLSPAAALELGLVSEVLPGPELLEGALAVAERLGSRPKLAVAAAKRAIYEGGSLPLPDGLRLESTEFIATLGSAEALELMGAYLAAIERTGELPLYDRSTLERSVARGHLDVG